jgi:hypothetical protein
MSKELTGWRYSLLLVFSSLVLLVLAVLALWESVQGKVSDG